MVLKGVPCEHSFDLSRSFVYTVTPRLPVCVVCVKYIRRCVYGDLIDLVRLVHVLGPVCLTCFVNLVKVMLFGVSHEEEY